jgi:probable phosphoglycerate mutase
VATTRLILIRHGHSTSQQGGIVSGHDTCGGLSAQGAEQAQRLAARLARTKELGDVDVIHTSLLTRAHQTAAAVRVALGVTSDVVEDCGFCELHPGEAEGMTWGAMLAKWPAAGDPDDPYLRRLPGMETWSEVAHRAGARLRELAAERVGATSVVVTHGGVVGASFHALGELPLRQVVGMTRATENTSITEWVQRPSGRWQLVRFNDAAHLLG